MPNIPAEIDPFIAERIAQIRDRFGMAGLSAARDLAAAEIAIFSTDAGWVADDRAADDSL